MRLEKEPLRKRRNQKSKNPTNQKQDLKQPSTRANYEKDKNQKPSRPKPKRDFVKKEVNKPVIEKEDKQKETVVKAKQEIKGKRHFSIRRKTNESDETKE